MKKIINLFEPGEGLKCLKCIYNLDDDTLTRIENRAFQYDSPPMSDKEIEEYLYLFNDFSGEELDQMNNILRERSKCNRNPIGNCVQVFFEETGIHPDVYDLSDVKVTFRHVMASIDHGDYLRKRGLLRLDELLEEDSPIKKFLDNNGIIIKLQEHKIVIDGQEIEIEMGGEFSVLASKLYHYKGETELFVSGSDEEIMNYSCIKNCPEILRTIDRYSKKKNLEEKWEQQRPETFLIEFDATLDETTINCMNTGSCGLDRFYLREYKGDIPLNVGRNDWIVRNCLYNSCRNTNMETAYAAIKFGVRIGADRLRIREI